MVKIGHASIDENNRGRNGQAGDQTGKEVCIREWYNKPWNVLLRPAEAYAEAMASACERLCANPNIGHDMNQRNTLHTQAKKLDYNLSAIDTPCETDCSAFITVCAIAAGIKALEYTGNAPTTSTMRRVFSSTNKFTVLTDPKYLTSDKWLRRGDVLVKEGSHTVMVLEDGSETKKERQSVFPDDMIGKDIRAVSAINLNARISPMGSKLFVLNAGEKVNVIEEVNGWCRVEAWVSSQHLVK